MISSYSKQMAEGLCGEAFSILVRAADYLPASFCEGYGMDVILRELERFIVGLSINLDDYFRVKEREISNVTKPGE